MDKSQVNDAAKQGVLSIDYLTSKVTLALGGITSRGITSTSRCGDGGIYEMIDTSWVLGALGKHHASLASMTNFVPF